MQPQETQYISLLIDVCCVFLLQFSQSIKSSLNPEDLASGLEIIPKVVRIVVNEVKIPAYSVISMSEFTKTSKVRI